MLVAELKNKLLIRMTFTKHRNSYLKSQIPFFSNVKKSDSFASTKTQFLNFELAHAVQNEASKMPSKDEICEKHRVLSISASTWLKKVDDSCRAASQPISLFLTFAYLTKLLRSGTRIFRCIKIYRYMYTYIYIYRHR